jgi:hypothetical protein
LFHLVPLRIDFPNLVDRKQRLGFIKRIEFVQHLRGHLRLLMAGFANGQE